MLVSIGDAGSKARQRKTAPIIGVGERRIDRSVLRLLRLIGCRSGFLASGIRRRSDRFLPVRGQAYRPLDGVQERFGNPAVSDCGGDIVVNILSRRLAQPGLGLSERRGRLELLASMQIVEFGDEQSCRKIVDGPKGCQHTARAELEECGRQTGELVGCRRYVVEPGFAG